MLLSYYKYTLSLSNVEKHYALAFVEKQLLLLLVIVKKHSALEYQKTHRSS